MTDDNERRKKLHQEMLRELEFLQVPILKLKEMIDRELEEQTLEEPPQDREDR